VLQERVALRRNRASRPDKGAIHEEESQEGKQESPQKGQIVFTRFCAGARSFTPLFFFTPILQKNNRILPSDSTPASSLTLTNNSLQMEIACATE
jgi:hypothetical protein